MHCYNCGEKITTDVIYCPKCGVNQKIELIENNDSSGSSIGSPNSSSAKMSSTKKAWSIAGGVLLVILVLSAISGGGTGSGIFGNGALNRPASDYLVTGDALVTLQQVWGVSLNDSNGPVSLKNMADQAYDYTLRSVGGGITKSDVEIAFQPGNSMYSFFGRLLNSQEAIDAVRDRWVSLAE